MTLRIYVLIRGDDPSDYHCCHSVCAGEILDLKCQIWLPALRHAVAVTVTSFDYGRNYDQGKGRS